MDAHERRNDLQRALLDINQWRQQENCELAAQGDQQLPAALQSDRKISAFVLSGHESDSIRGHTDSSKNKSRMSVLCEFKFFELPGSEGTLTVPRTKVECLFCVNSSSLNCQGPRAH